MTPLFYGQFVWSQKCQKSYIPYLYNTDTSVKRTIGSVPLVSVLKRFDCTFQMASDLIHAIGKSRFGFRISQWNENSFSQTPRKFTQTQRRILVKKIHLCTGLQSTGYGTRFFWISCLNPIYPIDGTLSLFPHRSTNGHFFFAVDIQSCQFTTATWPFLNAIAERVSCVRLRQRTSKRKF